MAFGIALRFLTVAAAWKRRLQSRQTDLSIAYRDAEATSEERAEQDHVSVGPARDQSRLVGERFKQAGTARSDHRLNRRPICALATQHGNADAE